MNRVVLRIAELLGGTRLTRARAATKIILSGLSHRGSGRPDAGLQYAAATQPRVRSVLRPIDHRAGVEQAGCRRPATPLPPRRSRDREPRHRRLRLPAVEGPADVRRHIPGAEDRRFHEGKRDDSRARHRQRKAHAGDHRRQPRVPAGDCNRKNVSPANEGGLILPSSCLSCSRRLVVGSLTIGNA